MNDRQRNTEKMAMTKRRGSIGRRKRIPWLENQKSWIGEDKVKIETGLVMQLNGVRRLKEVKVWNTRTSGMTMREITIVNHIAPRK